MPDLKWPTCFQLEEQWVAARLRGALGRSALGGVQVLAEREEMGSDEVLVLVVVGENRI